MKKFLSGMLAICLLMCCLLTACGSPAANKEEGTLSAISDLSKVYDGEAVGKPTYQTNNRDGGVTVTYYKQGSSEPIPAPSNAGSYTVKISIGEGTTVKAVEGKRDFVISKASPIFVIPEGVCAIAGDKLDDVDISSFGLAWVDGQTVVTESGSYPAKIAADPNNYTVDEGEFALKVTVVSEIVAMPSLKVSFEYDGEVKTISETDIEGFDPDKMEIDKSSTFSATETGTYTVTIKLKDKNACWENRLSTDIVLTWNIGSFKVECAKGTADCYSVTENENGEKTLNFFGNESDKTVYQISGEFCGNIVVDVGDDFKFEIEMLGLTLTSSYNSPIVILSGDKVTLTAKNGYDNFIYDNREEVTDEDLYSACIYSKVDLVLGGKGSLTVVSQNNNGIHTKDDLEVKNLTLKVTCCDNALKGNDGVTFTSGNATLIAKKGDGIKTSNSEIKYNKDGSVKKVQGTVAVLDGKLDIYAACDGIDASYNIEISGGSVNIFTDKYSPYSEEVTAVTSGIYYLRSTKNTYKYSVKYYNSESDFVWKNAQIYKTVSGNTTYYFYKVEKPTGYSKLSLFVYSEKQQQGQENECVAKVENVTVNSSYDTMLVTVGTKTTVSWTNYSTATQPATNPGMPGGPGGGFPGGGRPGPGGGFPGGMQEGNSDKGDYSTKGLKADNEIIITAGAVFVHAYDDAIHANSDVVLESGANGTGNIVISGGIVRVQSNDDGIHGDGTVTILGGEVTVTDSYEGIEGSVVTIADGTVSVVSKDDGINGTNTSGESIVISGGYLYVCAGGDGVDSNSRTSYDGILFSGGRSVIISTGFADSPIDTEAGYRFTGGYVLAVGRSGGMTNESLKVNTKQITSKNLTSNSFVGARDFALVELPTYFVSTVIVLGITDATIYGTGTCDYTLDSNGVVWLI